MISVKTFALNLNDLLCENNLTPLLLVDKISLPKSSIYRYLSGNTLPSAEIIIKLADFFNCSINFLVGLENDTHQTQFRKNVQILQTLPTILKKFNTNKYQLHKNIKISNTTLYLWQNEARFPSIETLAKIATYFDCSIDYLLGRED